MASYKDPASGLNDLVACWRYFSTPKEDVMIRFEDSAVGNFSMMKVLDKLANETPLDVDAKMGIAAQDIVQEDNAVAAKMAAMESCIDERAVVAIDARHRSMVIMELVHSLNYNYQSAKEVGSDAANAIDIAVDILMKDWDKARKEMRYAEQNAKTGSYNGCSGSQPEVCEKGGHSHLGRQGLQRR